MAEFEMKVVIPDDMTEVEDLGSLRTEIITTFARLLEQGKDNPATLADRQALHAAMQALTAEQERREQARAESDAVNSAFETLSKPAEPTAEAEDEPVEGAENSDEDSGEDSDDETEAEDEAEDAEDSTKDGAKSAAQTVSETAEVVEATEPVEPVAIAAEETITETAEVAATEADTTEREPVAAAVSHTESTESKSMSEIGGRTKAPAVAKREPIMFAASDVPGQSMGAPLTMESLATALADVTESMKGGVSQSRNLATIRRTFLPEFQQNGEDATEVARRAADSAQGRGPVEYAVTCAPPQILDGICNRTDPNEGIATWPSIQITRETIQWRRGLDWCDPAIAGFGTWTEAMANDPDAVKECARVTCLPPSECTVEPDWMCTITDIMKWRFDRESVTDFLEKQVVRYNRYRNARKIAAVVAAAGAPIVLPEKFGAAARLADAILLLATDIRKREAMSRNAVIHVKLPWETPELLMAAEGYREPLEALTLTMQRVVSFVAKHNVTVEFVHGLQAGLGSPPDSPGDLPAECTTPPALDWPDMIRILAYPAGAWVSADADIINIQTVYDAASLARNEFMVRFGEQTSCMLDLCPGTRLYEVPVCANGTVGGRNQTTESFDCAV